MCAIPIQEFEYFVTCNVIITISVRLLGMSVGQSLELCSLRNNFRQAVGYVSRSVAGTLSVRLLGMSVGQSLELCSLRNNFRQAVGNVSRSVAGTLFAAKQFPSGCWVCQ